MQDPKLLRRIDHVLELMRMMSAFTGNPVHEAIGIKQSHHKEITMLVAIQDFENHVKTEGRNDIKNIFTCLLAKGLQNDVMYSVQEPEYLKKMMKEFGINDEEEIDDIP